MVFIFPSIFGILDHNIMPFLVYLCFDLAAPNLRTSVFCFTSKTSENWRSYFLALVFLIVTDGPGDNVMLLVSPLGVETIAASMIALYWFLSSYLPEYLYNFLIFSRHLCSYNILWLNDWSTPMVTIRCFSHSDCNIPLIMTNLCSNCLILIIESITLVNYRDFLHCAARAVMSPIWKQRHYFLYWGSFYDVVEIEEKFGLDRGGN